MFTLYDQGDTYEQVKDNYLKLRCEHGTFMYRYEPCNVGNIRKMYIALPLVHPINLDPQLQQKYDKYKDNPNAIYIFAKRDANLQFKMQKIRPKKVSIFAIKCRNLRRQQNYLNKKESKSVRLLDHLSTTLPNGMQVSS